MEEILKAINERTGGKHQIINKTSESIRWTIRGKYFNQIEVWDSSKSKSGKIISKYIGVYGMPMKPLE